MWPEGTSAAAQREDGDLPTHLQTQVDHVTVVSVSGVAVTAQTGSLRASPERLAERTAPPAAKLTAPYFVRSDVKTVGVHVATVAPCQTRIDLCKTKLPRVLNASPCVHVPVPALGNRRSATTRPTVWQQPTYPHTPGRHRRSRCGRRTLSCRGGFSCRRRSHYSHRCCVHTHLELHTHTHTHRQLSRCSWSSCPLKRLTLAEGSVSGEAGGAQALEGRRRGDTAVDDRKQEVKPASGLAAASRGQTLTWRWCDSGGSRTARPAARFLEDKVKDGR